MINGQSNLYKFKIIYINQCTLLFINHWIKKTNKVNKNILNMIPR